MKRIRPNILIITTHDTGRHLGCYGIEQVHSPCIDALAARGVRMSRYFATAPICCPSRATMMTGRFPQSHGMMDLCFPPFDWQLNPGEQHLSHVLRRAGFRTRLLGLHHEVQDVSQLGFDSVPTGPIQPCDAVAREVVSFLRSARSDQSPFYAQVGFFETHSPFTWGHAEPDDGRGVFVPPYVVANELSTRLAREFQGSIRKMDAAVGAIVEALDESGLAEDTILIVTTDHGIEFPRAKWTLYDPGLESMLLVHWPTGGVCGGRVCDWLLSNVDLMPTILDLADVASPENVQGLSFAGALNGPSVPPRRREIFAMFAKRSQSRCIRTDDFKLIRNFETDRWYAKPVDMMDPADYGVTPTVELYDLRTDPLEFHNLADDAAHAETRAALDTRLRQWLEAVEDPVLRGPLRPPFYERSLRQLTGGTA